jgi:glycine/D-amino acid oxidase-like deaminating enzyme
MLDPERSIAAALTVARRHGAQVRTGETVLRWRQAGDGVVVETPQGSYRAGQLVLSAGMWIGELVRELALPLTVQRNALYWFEPRRDSTRPTQSSSMTNAGYRSRIAAASSVSCATPCSSALRRAPRTSSPPGGP